MTKSAQPPSEVVQTSITMPRHLKERYAKLAVTLDLSFSQLVRYALRRVEEGYEDYASIEKESEKHASVPNKKAGGVDHAPPAKQ